MSNDPNSNEPVEASESVDEAVAQYGDNFVLRQKVLKIFGQAFHVYDMNNQVCFFAKLKALLRKAAARTIDDLWAAIAEAIELFTPAECVNFFVNSGYKPN